MDMDDDMKLWLRRQVEDTVHEQMRDLYRQMLKDCERHWVARVTGDPWYGDPWYQPQNHKGEE